MNNLSLSVEIKLNSVDYLISLSVENGDTERLLLEVNDLGSAMQWKAQFESNYIEDLTRKTGNFKSFSIFINMLITALKQESEAVSLDLLTFNDLEMLRNKKLNGTSSTINSTSSGTKQNLNQNKRVLILTYNVEFDRINYPLQLSFVGKLDQTTLLNTIKMLKLKLNAYENGHEATGSEQNELSKVKEIIKYQKENERLKKEKELIELEFFKFKEMVEAKLKEYDVMNNSKTAGDNNNSESMKSLVTLNKEIKLLKKMIKSMEEGSMKEKTSYQKQLMKKKEEINQLNDDIFKLKTNERNLLSQIKTLTNELALSRRAGRSRDMSKEAASKRGNLTSTRTSRVSSVESLKRRPMPSIPNARGASPMVGRSNSANSLRRPLSASSKHDTDKRAGSTGVRSRSNSRFASPASSYSGSLFNSDDEKSYRSSSLSKRQQLDSATKTRTQRLREMEITKKHNLGGRQSRQPIVRTPSSSSLNRMGYESDSSRRSNGSAKKSSMNTMHHVNSNRVSYQAQVKVLNENTSDEDSRLYKHKNSLASNQKSINEESSRFDRDDELNEIDDKLKSLELLIKNAI